MGYITRLRLRRSGGTTPKKIKRAGISRAAVALLREKGYSEIPHIIGTGAGGSITKKDVEAWLARPAGDEEE